jgi:hypothetical protein
MAYNHDLCKEVLAIFNRIVNQYYCQQANADGILEGKTGSISFVQMSGGALNLNVHIHATCLDGVFYQDGNTDNQPIKFRPAQPPNDTQMAVIVSQIRYEVLCHLRDRGLLDADWDSDQLADETPLHEQDLSVSEGAGLFEGRASSPGETGMFHKCHYFASAPKTYLCPHYTTYSRILMRTIPRRPSHGFLRRRSNESLERLKTVYSE